MPIYIDGGDDDPRWDVMALILEQRYVEARDMMRRLGGISFMQSAAGDSILHDAASDGQTELVKLLLEDASPEQVNMFDSDYLTPLAHASQAGHTETVVALLDSGADPNLRDVTRNDYSPLCWAVIGGHAEVVVHLLRAGADPDQECWMGLAARHQAALMLARSPSDAAARAISQYLTHGRMPPN